MNNNKDAQKVDRSRERACIEEQVEAFLAKGGRIEVLKSAFEIYKDPKCRLGDNFGYFK
jgi:hypothetical protein